MEIGGFSHDGGRVDGRGCWSQQDHWLSARVPGGVVAVVADGDGRWDRSSATAQLACAVFVHKLTELMEQRAFGLAREALTDGGCVREALLAAAARCYEDHQGAGEAGGASLAAVLLREDGGAWTAHVGGGRAWGRSRGVWMSLLGPEHRDEEGAVTHWLGMHPGRLEPSERFVSAASTPGVDRVVLATEGFYAQLENLARVPAWLQATAGAEPEEAARSLVQDALSRAGRDNVTAVVIQRREETDRVVWPYRIEIPVQLVTAAIFLIMGLLVGAMIKDLEVLPSPPAGVAGDRAAGSAPADPDWRVEEGQRPEAAGRQGGAAGEGAAGRGAAGEGAAGEGAAEGGAAGEGAAEGGAVGEGVAEEGGSLPPGSEAGGASPEEPAEGVALEDEAVEVDPSGGGSPLGGEEEGGRAGGQEGGGQGVEIGDEEAGDPELEGEEGGPQVAPALKIRARVEGEEGEGFESVVWGLSLEGALARDCGARLASTLREAGNSFHLAFVTGEGREALRGGVKRRTTYEAEGWARAWSATLEACPSLEAACLGERSGWWVIFPIKNSAWGERMWYGSLSCLKEPPSPSMTVESPLVRCDVPQAGFVTCRVDGP